LPILEGLDGVQKMSKSLGNYVGVTDSPHDMFGKLMSVSDELMTRYYLLLLGRGQTAGQHPMEAKKQLAREIVATYHSENAAKEVATEWEQRFSAKRLDEANLPRFKAPVGESNIVALVVAAYAISFGLTKSRGEARRLIEQGSVQLGGNKISDLKAQIVLQPGDILRLDKTRAVRVD
jgi:tyrosyl-tRNA synthetase